DFTTGTGTVVPEFIVIPPVEPTTVPTTAEPTTEPTTAEPTTVEPTTVEPTTAEPTTVEPTTVVPTTVAPTTVGPKSFTVTATSNFSNKDVKEYTTSDKQVKVTYSLRASQLIACGEWQFTYDNTILKFNKATTGYPEASVMPYIDSVGGSVTNVWERESFSDAYGNFSNVPGGYDFMNGRVLFEATFDIVGNYDRDTTIDLQLLNLGAIDMSTQQIKLVDYIVDGIPTPKFDEECAGTAVLDGPDVPTVPTTVAPTTVAPTTVAPTTVEPTTAPVPTTEPATTAPVPTTEPATTAPVPTTEPATTAPVPTTEPATTAPVPTTEPATTAPVPTTEPATTAPVPTTEPATTTPVPTSEPASTAAPTSEPTPTSTQAPSATSATGATSKTATPDSTSSTTTGNGTVKTSDSPVAIMLLILLVAATGFVVIVRKREMDK
ncbi:MAG: hypothetical protein ACI4G1_05695, partial [Ruminococcus sp.]